LPVRVPRTIRKGLAQRFFLSAVFARYAMTAVGAQREAIRHAGALPGTKREVRRIAGVLDRRLVATPWVALTPQIGQNSDQ
jgi:hypothetical protein